MQNSEFAVTEQESEKNLVKTCNFGCRAVGTRLLFHCDLYKRSQNGGNALTYLLTRMLALAATRWNRKARITAVQRKLVMPPSAQNSVSSFCLLLSAVQFCQTSSIGRSKSCTAWQTAAKNAFSVKHGLRRQLLDAFAAAVLLHLEILTILPPTVPMLIVLKVSVDVEVVVHVVGFVRLQPLGEVVLQLLQPLLGQEVSLGKHHLEKKKTHLTFVTSA